MICCFNGSANITTYMYTSKGVGHARAVKGSTNINKARSQLAFRRNSDKYYLRRDYVSDWTSSCLLTRRDEESLKPFQEEDVASYKRTDLSSDQRPEIAEVRLVTSLTTNRFYTFPLESELRRCAARPVLNLSLDLWSKSIFTYEGGKKAVGIM